MKINIIIPSFYPAIAYGGPIDSSLNTCKYLANMENVEIRVSTTNANMNSKLDVSANKWINFEDDFFVKYYDETVINRFSLMLFFNLWKDIKDADVVNVQSVFSSPSLIALFWASIFNKKTLLSPHGQLSSWALNNGSQFKKIFLNFFIKPLTKNTIWHATSESEKLDILKLFPANQVEVINNGIDTSKFISKPVQLESDFFSRYTNTPTHLGKNIISMGRLHSVKGFDLLIKSFVGILAKYNEARLFIAGPDEGEKCNLQKLIIENHCEDRIFLVGNITGVEKINFLINADLFVLPSHSENFGIVYAESLAAGTPIVASQNTPWSEVEQAGCGRWIPNEISEITEAMIYMLNKDKEKMSINSRLFAEQFNWPIIACQFDRLFKRMCLNSG